MKNLIFLFTMLIVVASNGQSNDEVLTNSSVINLCTKGLSPSIIISKIKTSKTNFDVTSDALIKLKEQKISDDIVNAMVEASANTENISGDTNDPNSYHESGIYYYNPIINKPEMILLEPSVSAQTKTGSGIGSALTYGAASTKTKAKLDGAMAHLQLDEPSPVFYFYFDKGSNLNNSSTFFASATSPNEFILVKMDAKKKSREFVTGKNNVYSGSAFGVDEKQKIEFEFTKIKTGVYKVTSKNKLMPGEYCFMYAGNSTGYGAAGKVYDFGIKSH